MEFGRNVSVVTPPTDLEKWEAVGSVRTIRRELASWDSPRGDWGTRDQREEGDFNRAGQLVEERLFNSDGSTIHAHWSYDGAGRIIEVRRWSDSWSTLTRCLYDAQGRPLRTIDVGLDGKEREAETWGLDEQGRSTKVQFLPAVATAPADKYDFDEMVAFHFDAQTAVTATSIYDRDWRLIEVRYHDQGHQPLFYVTLTRDNDGRIVSMEIRFTGLASLWKDLEQDLAQKPEEEQRRLREALDMTFDDHRFMSVSYERDSSGRVLTSTRRMGTLDETRSTYTYDIYGNVLECLEEHTDARLEVRDAGPIVRHEGQSTHQHQRFDYVYDVHGNWTEKVSWMDTGEDVTRASIEHREFTYYTE